MTAWEEKIVKSIGTVSVAVKCLCWVHICEGRNFYFGHSTMKIGMIEREMGKAVARARGVSMFQLFLNLDHNILIFSFG